MNYIYLIFAIIFETIATTLLKGTNGFTVVVPTVLSLGCYAFSFYFLSLCLLTLPTGVVYAIWSGLGIVLISVAAFFINKQVLDIPAILGMCLIVSGVIVIKVFSKTI